MLMHKIEYVDFNGRKHADTLYFHLSKTDIAKLQVKGDGTFIDDLKRLLEKKKIEKIFDFFYNLVLDAYGEKSEDGTRFIRNPELRQKFENSIAFDEFFNHVISSEENMTNFVRSIIPYDLPEELPALKSGGSDAASDDTGA